MSEELFLAINESSNSTNATECGYSEGPVSLQRFIIIFVCSLIASVGVLCNLSSWLVSLFSMPYCVSRGWFISPPCTINFSSIDHSIFPFPAPGDIEFVQKSSGNRIRYVLLFGVDASCNHLQVEFLFRLYHDYLKIIFFLCRVVQFAMPYMLILATLERFTWTAGDQMRFLQCFFSDRGRQITAMAIIIISLAFRIIVYFSFEIVEFPNCDDLFSSISPVPLDFASHDLYMIYEVQIVTSLQTVIPFIVLIVLNAMIIIKMCGEKRDQVCTQHMVKKASIIANSSSLPEHYVLMEVTNGMVQESFNSKTNREKAIQLRNAVFTMLVIVLSYLVCNGLNLFLLYYEKFDSEALYVGDSRVSTNFYIALSDSVSISYMLSSAIRLFIYAKCNPKLRKELKQYLWGMEYVPTSEEDS